MLVPIMLHNRWQNARLLGIHVISSHTFCEGNSFSDMLASMGHAIVGVVWTDTLPTDVHPVFLRDRCGLPNYRSLELFFGGSIISVYFSVFFLLFSFEGFGLVPPLFVIIFPPFFNKFLECGGIRWRCLGVPTWQSGWDVDDTAWCSFTLLTYQKKIKKI